MNTLNSKTNESNRFIYQFNDKLNFKSPNKNMALANLNIYYTTTTNLKFLLQLGMMNLICLMDVTLFLTYKVISNISSKNMKLL